MEQLSKVRYIFLGMVMMALLGTAVVSVLAAQGNKQLDAEYDNIKIVIDGEAITPKDAGGNVVEPFVVNGTTYLPVRAMCEAIGYNVEWDENTSTVYVYSLDDNNPGIQSTDK